MGNEARSREEEQERLDYIFQHNYNRVEQAAKRLGEKEGQFPMKIPQWSSRSQLPNLRFPTPSTT